MRPIDADALMGVPNVRKVTEYDESGEWISYLAVPVEAIKSAPTVEAEPVRIDGNTSDGYHTFNELYHHRAVLFSVIVKAFPQKAWKSRKHHDGTMFDGMFIVGIETPDGQATYHYDFEPYWDMFNCNEVEFAPEWDGHTPQQAIERIGKLEPVRNGRWIHDINNLYGRSLCCNRETMGHKKKKNYCPNCGAKMDLEEGSDKCDT